VVPKSQRYRLRETSSSVASETENRPHAACFHQCLPTVAFTSAAAAVCDRDALIVHTLLASAIERVTAGEATVDTNPRLNGIAAGGVSCPRPASGTYAGEVAPLRLPPASSSFPLFLVLDPVLEVGAVDCRHSLHVVLDLVLPGQPAVLRGQLHSFDHETRPGFSSTAAIT
jgi:hypothetical protein